MNGGLLLIGNFLSHARGHRHYCEDLADRLEARGRRVIRSSSRPGRIGKVADMVATTWSLRHDYDLAHVDLYSGAAFAWAEVVAFELGRLRKPFVLSLHGGNLPEFAGRWPKRVRRLLHTAAAVTAPSGYLRSELAVYAPEVVALPNALELARYPFRLRATPRCQLVWLRAFHAVYNPVLAVDVLARLCQRTPETMLRMIGPDRGDGSLEQVHRRARELGVSRQVEIVGPIPNQDVPRHLADADVLLNTTNVDNTPVSVLEAMACGLCVVSTDVGGIPHLVAHEREGLLVPPRDPEAMANAVERLFDEPDLAATISGGGRARALSCDWNGVLDLWDELFTRIRARA